MADAPHPSQIQLQVQLDDDVAQGMYVNMAMVHHSETEFTLDMLYVLPHQPKAKVRARLITSPKHMKRLLLSFRNRFSATSSSSETSTCFASRPAPCPSRPPSRRSGIRSGVAFSDPVRALTLQQDQRVFAGTRVAVLPGQTKA